MSWLQRSCKHVNTNSSIITTIRIPKRFVFVSYRNVHCHTFVLVKKEAVRCVSRDSHLPAAVKDTKLEEDYHYISFYKYFAIEKKELEKLRKQLLSWSQYGVRGRIYIAEEGINAQMMIPCRYRGQLENLIEECFPNGKIHLNEGDVITKESPPPFFTLHVRIRSKIVSDLTDINKIGVDFMSSNKYLTPQQWNETMDSENANVKIVDCRNWYETEIGRFENAISLKTARTKELLSEVKEKIQKDQKIMIYCTGGIRCEKIGAVLNQEGYSNVFQLRGGILNYMQQVKKGAIKSNFKGKNFVFDDRINMGNVTERVTNDVLSNCHSCGAKSDLHLNCAYHGCHSLFVQCTSCSEKLNKCCSELCVSLKERGETEEFKEEGKLLRKLIGKVQNLRPKGDAYVSRNHISSKEFQFNASTLAVITKVLTLSSIDTIPTLLENYCKDNSDKKSHLQFILDNSPAYSRSMSTGAWQGALLSFLASKSENTLELGTLYGYSAACIAESLSPSGHLTTVDSDSNSLTIARKNLSDCGFTNITTINENAMNFLKSFKGKPFDFIYIDADKVMYKEYYDFILDNNLLSPNGIILADNVLYKGDAVHAWSNVASKKSIIMAQFNKYVSEDIRVSKLMLPIRDGLLLVKLKGSPENSLATKDNFSDKKFLATTNDSEIPGKICNSLSNCHLCGEKSDSHLNCAYTGCHSSFVQCALCSEKLNKCCSTLCVSLKERGETEEFKEEGKILKKLIAKVQNLNPKGDGYTMSTFDAICKLLSLSSIDAIPALLENYCRDNSDKKSHYQFILDNSPVYTKDSNTGAWQGALLSILASRSENALELGTLYGYSAACIAESLSPSGHLTTVDSNTNFSKFARKNLSDCGFTNITTINENAMNFLKSYKGKPFDFIYIDADKVMYKEYYDFILDNNLLSPNGIILINDVLSHGDCIHAFSNAVLEVSKEALSIAQFNKYVSEDIRVSKLMLPIRNGLLAIKMLNLNRSK